jgi:hypothetical protein
MSDWQSIRGDAASLPTDPMNMTFRPTGVTVVGYLIWVAAAWQAIVGVFAIIAAISSDQAERFFKGQLLGGVSDSYLWFFGIASICVAYLLVIVARSLLEGDDFARIAVIALAALQIVFALFAFPWGVLTLIASVVIIGILCGPKATRWFDATSYEIKRVNAFQ